MRVIITVMVATGLFAAMAMANSKSPYSGQEGREIKSMSQSDVAGYLAGKGMGFAKPAELNSYPGPRHVLDLAKELGMTTKQLKSTQELYDSMEEQASKLGQEYVAAERELDQLFASGNADQATLKAQVDKVARIRGEFRYSHLVTHLEMKKIMSRHQVMMYDRLRGYSGRGAMNQDHGGGHNHHGGHQ